MTTTGDRTGARTGAERVLVLDANRNCSLSFARSLHDRGVKVTAGGRSRVSRAGLSGATHRTYVYPDPIQQPTRFVDHLVGFLDRTDHAAVVPMTDPTTSILSKHRDEIEGTGTVPGVEDWETFVAANDKAELAELAADLSVPAPDTYVPDSFDDVVDRAEAFSYPVLVKPRLTSVAEADGGYREIRISNTNYADSPGELVSTYRSFLKAQGDSRQRLPIVQEVVPGTTMATAALADGGEVLAYFQEERLRTYPVDGGVGALRAGVREPAMCRYATTIIEALGWTGPIYVEFMKLPDGSFRLIEVNGRYWGSLALAVNSGVDFPWLHYRQLRGHTPTHDGNYRTDVKQRRLFYRDVNWLRTKLARGEYGAVYPFLAAFVDSREEVLRADDPLPLAGVAWDTAKQLAETYR